MTLSSKTRFIIQASNTGRYAKLTGNGRSYRLPGRDIVTTDLSPRKSAGKRGGNFGHKAGGGPRRPGSNANPLIISKPGVSAVQSHANDKVNEVAHDGKTTGADWESAIRACLQYKSK